MSTNGINACEDAEMADCDGEKIVTMMDVLKEQEDIEEDANAVLGASDDKNCTYSKGYIKRQAIYACMTCCADAKNDPTQWAGVCLACSLSCHESHDLIELYTKRNFRCDCGNPKFNAHPCQFTPDKTELNKDNIYNQNFGGVYCVCNRPYPDPDVDTQGDMIQCIICEDWLHSNHLEAVVPPNDQYSEMICKACMDKNEFLHDYSELAVNKENMDVDILNTSSEITTTTKNIENSNAEAVDTENIDNLNNDDIANKQTENNEVDVKVNDEDVIDNKQKNNAEPHSVTEEDHENTSDDSKREEQNSGDNHNEVNAVELQNDKNNAERNDDQADINMTADANEKTDDNLYEKVIPQIEEDLKASENPENRSREQVEEDLLLADPTETEIKSNNDLKSNKEVSEKKSDSETMDTSEPDNENQVQKTEDKEDFISNTDESEKTTTAEQSENVTTEEQSKNLTDAKQIENVSATAQTENGSTAEQIAEEPRTEESEDVPVTDHSTSEQQETAGNSENLQKECPESETNAETSSNIEQTEDVAEKLEQHVANANNGSVDVPMDENNTETVDKIVIGKDNPSDVISNENNTEHSINNDIPNDDCDKEVPVNKVETDNLKRKLSTDTDIDNIEVKKPKLEESKCVRPKVVKKVYHGATFWPSNFRHKLCTCNDCISMYRDLSVLFLTDPEDTVTAYETLGKDITDGKPASQYEKGMAALSSLGRVQQINALTEYGKLKDKLLDFLKTFKENKVVVKEEDIKAFFAGMKPVREPDGVYFCR